RGRGRKNEYSTVPVAGSAAYHCSRHFTRRLFNKTVDTVNAVLQYLTATDIPKTRIGTPRTNTERNHPSILGQWRNLFYSLQQRFWIFDPVITGQNQHKLIVKRCCRCCQCRSSVASPWFKNQLLRLY